MNIEEPWLAQPSLTPCGVLQCRLGPLHIGTDSMCRGGAVGKQLAGYVVNFKARTELHRTNRNDEPPRLAQSRGAEEGSMSDLVIQDGQQFGSDVNKVPAHPCSSQYKGHASTCLHAHVAAPTVTIPQLSTPNCDRLEWPSQLDSCCFNSWGFQSCRDEAPCLDLVDMFSTHSFFSFSTVYAFAFI